MKKRILALALAICAAVSLLVLPAGATLSEQSGEVQTVRALGIIVGDQNGNLNLGSNVTRAEFAKMMVAASTYKDTVGTGTGVSLFRDVKSDHWASQYIKIAVENGWMVGYTDGTFRPDNTITLEETCATVLRLLGYDSSTLAGSFPTAQLSKASALGLRDQITVQQGGTMTRADCVYLFYNLMTAQTSTGKVYANTIGYTVTNGQVDYAGIISGNLSGPFVAEGNTLPLPFTPTTVYRNGKVSSLSAVTQYDVYYYNSSMQTVWVYTDRAGGTITALSPNSAAPTSVTLGGKTYAIGTATATYKLSALGGFQVGDTALLLLGMNGEVVDVVSGGAVDTIYYGVVTASAKGTAAAGGAAVVTNVTVACTDGVERTFSVEKDTTYSVGTIVSASISDGSTTVNGVGSKSLSGTVNTSGTKIGSYTFADNVEIIDVSDNGAYARIYPSRLAGCSIPSSAVKFYVLNGSGQISHLILKDATGDTWKYGYLVSMNVAEQAGGISFTATYTYVLDGVTKTITLQNMKYPVTSGGIAIQFDSMGSIKSMKSTASVALSSMSSLSAVGGSKTYRLADDVQVYLRQGGNYYLTELSDINTDEYSLVGWYDSFSSSAGGRIRVIIATAK